MQINLERNTLGTRLRQIRQDLRLSQQEVADEIGWLQSEISALERGGQVKLTAERLAELMRLYGMSPNEIYEIAGWWEGDSQSPMDFYWNLLRETTDGLPSSKYHELMTRLVNLARGWRVAYERELQEA